mmetsp:Transcript_18803/g.42017  ORF Transcript_18803/g.42017 Transcript_18803/m.42017 type:complete len:102 (-) Transcript_18803:1766-2071(-)
MVCFHVRCSQSMAAHNLRDAKLLGFFRGGEHAALEVKGSSLASVGWLFCGVCHGWCLNSTGGQSRPRSCLLHCRSKLLELLAELQAGQEPVEQLSEQEGHS